MAWLFDFLIVGGGFSGAVLAERLASQCGKSSLIIERRSHIGGNAFDYHDKAGVLVHAYGPHYFRTNSDRVREYLSQFTEWHAVDYKIMSCTDGKLWSFPINLNTFEQLIGRPSRSSEMEAQLEKWRMPITNPQNSEELILSQVGPLLYEKFFKNYTRKQWGRDPRELDASVCGRIPIRTNRDERYLREKFQAMPREGYTRMFERMLDHPKIRVTLETDFREVRGKVSCKHMIYSGPIDEYFDCCFGPLPYRSLRFEHETFEKEWHQPVVQVNYPNDFDFTRVVEIKHVTGQQLPVTTIVREYPLAHGPEREPYYPIPAPDSRSLYARYAALAANELRVTFLGRLGTYRYYNMDQCVGLALAEFDRLKRELL
jgi:UDP-galactopyranose mutase